MPKRESPGFDDDNVYDGHDGGDDDGDDDDDAVYDYYDRCFCDEERARGIC